MSLAVDRKADRIWIVNVGDLKPYELDTEFFITYGWNSSIWNRNNLDSFVTSWAQREFDVSQNTANDVSEIIANLTRFNARRKPELLNSTSYSLWNYREYVHLSCITVMVLMIRFPGLRLFSMLGQS